MNKPRLVKREEINQQQGQLRPSATPKPSMTQIRQAVQERTRPAAANSVNARAAFAALFARA